MTLPVAHVESACAASTDDAEEVNRIVADELSEPTVLHAEAIENLRAEGLDERMHFVGNTMIDTWSREGASTDRGAGSGSSRLSS